MVGVYRIKDTDQRYRNHRGNSLSSQEIVLGNNNKRKVTKVETTPSKRFGRS